MGVLEARSPLERILRIALLALAALLGLAPAVAAPRAANRIVAVGDLHGDFAAWTAIARAAGLTDDAGHWTGGDTTLVQLGDVTDRGPDSLKIIRNLQQLAAEAPAAGGKVVVLLGNHEAMNLVGDLRYVSPGEFAAFADERSPARRERLYMAERQKLEAAARKLNPAALPSQVRDAWLADHPLGWVEHRAAWSPSGELGRWATRNPAVVKIDGTLFVHGGISAEYAQLSIETINRRVAAAMAAGDDSPASVLDDPLGPLWYRGLIGRDRDAEERRTHEKPPSAAISPQQELEAVLSAYDAQRMVVGHTPSLGGIQLSEGGRLARIDTGISRAYGGTLSWLEIVGGKMVPHVVGRTP